MRIRDLLTDPLSPLAFVLGLAASFFYLRHLGAEAAQKNPFEKLERAPQALNPTTGCAPTILQMMAMCKARAGANRIIVVVGGNSVFLGIRQPLEQLWTKHLQEVLGDGFAVVNLAQRGQSSAGGAGSVAEALHKEGRRVIYLTNMSLPAMGPPDGRDPYSYTFYNAQARGLLYSFPERDHFLATWADPFIDRSELRIRAQFDRFSNAEDLWNALSYASFSTVWDVVPYNRSYRPRSESKDYEAPSLPVPQRFADSLEREVAQIPIIVSESQRYEVTSSEFADQIRASFPPQMRPNVLMVITAYSPYYIRHASEDLQKRYAGFLVHAANMLRAGGLRTMEVGSDFEDEDYGDFVHFDPSGGRKLAERVAPEIQKMAKELYGN